MAATEFYSWGTPAMMFHFGNFVAARPALSEREWDEIDVALQASTARTARCGWRVTIVLVADHAENMGRGVYVINEGGPPTLHAVIAIGHADRSVSWCVDSDIARDNAVQLKAMVDCAQRALDRGSLSDALLSVAAAMA